MKCFINGQEYKFIKDALKDNDTRMSYFKLTKQIYRLEFEKWYQPDYWDNRFIPYIIMHKDIVVSGVAVCINDICWHDQRKRYVQISTVMANESTKVVYLGFTPKSKEGYIIEESQEQDTHLFVLKGKENIFKDNRVMFPILSRA